MNKVHIADLLKLSLPERIILAESLWDSIAAEKEKSEISQEEINILEERLASYRKSNGNGKSWDEIKSAVLKSL